MNNVNKYTNHSYKVIHLNYKLPLSDDVTVISVLLHLNGDIDTKNFSFYATQSIFSKPGNYKISLSIDLTVIDKFTILGKTDSRAFNISRMFDGYNKRFYNKTTTRRLPLLPSLGRNRVQIGDFYFDFFINCIAIYLIRLLKMFERGGRNYLKYNCWHSAVVSNQWLLQIKGYRHLIRYLMQIFFSLFQENPVVRDQVLKYLDSKYFGTEESSSTAFDV